MTKIICQNCDFTGAAEELKYRFPAIPDLVNRIEPGDPVPFGECPECGALVHEVEEIKEQFEAEESPEKQVVFKEGDRIYWHDPEDGITSNYGTVVDTDHPELIVLKMDSGSEVEALLHELEFIETPKPTETGKDSMMVCVRCTRPIPSSPNAAHSDDGFLCDACEEAENGRVTAEDLRNLYGHWGCHPDHLVSEWIEEVQNKDTRLGYWEWVAAREYDG
ncbi:MAG: hypothetical protein K9K82_14470 [Desulfobacteraceae bacterium]|nr:hypothetical protein [Desulfobacteraceae bacterium]